MKSESSRTAATPFASWPEPTSSNQFIGDSMAESAILRCPPSTGTTACLAPEQLRLPAESTQQPRPVALLKAKNERPEALSLTASTVVQRGLLFSKYPAKLSSAVPRIAANSVWSLNWCGSLVSPHTPAP